MLQEKMQKASDELEFEQAMEYRDLLKSIERIMDRQKINTYAFERKTSWKGTFSYGSR